MKSPKYYLVIEGEYYEVKASSLGTPTFVKQNKNKIKLKIQRAKEMAKKLKDNLDGEKVLTEALLTNFDDKAFDKLYNQLFNSKINYKPKTRAHRCVDMKVGNTIIPIVN
jgi:hypothetical protein